MAVDVEPNAPPSHAGWDGPDQEGPAQAAARRRWSAKRIVAGVAVLAVLGAVLVLTGGSGEEPAPDQPVEDAAPPLTGELEDGFVVSTDPETGISVQHPESWVPLERPTANRPLVLGVGGESTFSVRVEPIDGVVDTPELLAQVQAATDRIAGAPGVQVIQRQPIQINGMLGISYLSRFTDEESGTNVVNAQYFLFKGRTMYVILFQVAPETDFERLAPTFDKVLNSFQGAPIEEAPAPGGTASE